MKKMTVEEAIKELGEWYAGFVDNPSEEAIKTVMDAAGKHISKKPTYDGDGYAPDGTFVWDEWLCPKCGSRYEVDYDDYDYCPCCGQRIDWSEVKK